MHAQHHWTWPALVIALATLGCTKGRHIDGGVASAKTVGLDDGQVAQVLVTLNTGEVDAAKAALPKLQNENARSFANMMVSAHSQSNEEITQLLDGERITPVANDISRALEDGAQSVIGELQTTDSTDIDARYMHSQVTMHHGALTLIDCVLLKSPHNDALQTHLRTKVRPTVESHWQQARMAEGTLSRMDGPSTDLIPTRMLPSGAATLAAGQLGTGGGTGFGTGGGSGFGTGGGSALGTGGGMGLGTGGGSGGGSGLGVGGGSGFGTGGGMGMGTGGGSPTTGITPTNMGTTPTNAGTTPPTTGTTPTTRSALAAQAGETIDCANICNATTSALEPRLRSAVCRR